MFLISWVNTLRRISSKEIFIEFQPADTLYHRQALILCHAWIHRTFIYHNITNMMVAPAESINDSVFALCDNYKDITLPEANQEINNIRQQGETILELLSEKFKISPNETGKEDSHE